MKFSKLLVYLFSSAMLLVAGCGGVINATIGGTVSGLSGGTQVVLQDNGADTLTVPANGSFTFATQVEAGSPYEVTVATPPPGETCTITNGIGTVSQSVGNVTSVFVQCNATQSSNTVVTGNVNGLAAGQSVTLQNYGDGSVTVSSSTGLYFAFASQVLGSAYDVTVSAQPSSQKCTVANGTGTLTAAGEIPTGATASALVIVTCQ